MKKRTKNLENHTGGLKKRIISLLICACMIMAIRPAVALADEGSETSQTTDQTTETTDVVKYGKSASELTSTGSWNDAIAAVNAGSANYIQLQNHVWNDDGLVPILHSGTVTVDLAGYRLLGTSQIAASGNVTITIIDSGEGGALKLQVKDQLLCLRHLVQS